MGKVKHQAGRVLVWKQNSKRSGPRHEIDGVGKLYASPNVPRFSGGTPLILLENRRGKQGAETPKRAERS